MRLRTKLERSPNAVIVDLVDILYEADLRGKIRLFLNMSARRIAAPAARTTQPKSKIRGGVAARNRMTSNSVR